MNGLNDIVAESVKELINGKAAEQYSAVRSCESRSALMALTGLISIGAVGVGKANAVDGLWVSKKAADAMPKMIAELGALLDPDEVLEALRTLTGEEQPGGMLPDGFTAPAEWSEGLEGGLDDEEPAKAAPAARETLASLKARIGAGIDFEDEGGMPSHREYGVSDYSHELALEEGSEEGARKGVVKWLSAQISRLERIAAKEEAKAAKAKAKAEKAEAKAKAKAEAKAVREAKAEAAREAKANLPSKWDGLFELPDDGDPIDEDEDRECPKCKEVKPVGEGFGYRVMRRIVMHATGVMVPEAMNGGDLLDFVGQEIYVQAVKVTTRNQSQCKSCRGKKADS